jgi:hypothetical protein
LFPSSHGTRLAVFSTPFDRENAIANGPYVGREASVFFRRHDETDNRFVFEHDAMAALAIRKYPMEHWQRFHITHSSGPYANPHTIDPICLTGVDYHAVLVTVKAESITDIPINITIKNHCGNGSIGDITIIDFEDLAPGSNHSSGPDLDSIPEAFSSGDEEELLLEGGTPYAEVMQLLGVPPPLVPQGEPHSAAPAASLVARALANAPPAPTVRGGPILSKPTKVVIKLLLGFFDVFVTGEHGEQAFFRLPLRKAGSDLGCKGLMVANFATASVGLVDSIALVGPRNCPTLTVDILARGEPLTAASFVPLAVATDLVLGPERGLALSVPLEAPIVVSPAACPSPVPSMDSPVLAPSVAALASLAAPTTDTPWPASTAPRVPRRCSRLATSGFYISIIDKAMNRRKEINEGPAAAERRRGELDAQELLDAALEMGGPLEVPDVHALAKACDVPLGALSLGDELPLVSASSP